MYPYIDNFWPDAKFLYMGLYLDLDVTFEWFWRKQNPWYIIVDYALQFHDMRLKFLKSHRDWNNTTLCNTTFVAFYICANFGHATLCNGSTASPIRCRIFFCIVVGIRVYLHKINMRTLESSVINCNQIGMK